MPTEPQVVDALTRVLVRACRALGAAGHPREAGRLAADGWVAVRGAHPRQARHLDGVMHHIARLEGIPTPPYATAKEAAVHTEDRVLDIRTEIPKRRHELIFETFGALAPDTGYVLVNDHDPKPLYYQLSAENPGEFSWDYLEEGPEVWRVRIGRIAAAPPGTAP